MTKQLHRKIPLLGEVALIPLYLFFATLHVLCSPFGKQVEAAVVLLVFGGRFALVFLPIPLLYGVFYVLDDMLGFCDKSALVSWVAIPICV